MYNADQMYLSIHVCSHNLLCDLEANSVADFNEL